MNVGYMGLPHPSGISAPETYTARPAVLSAQPFPGIRLCTEAEQAGRLAFCAGCDKNSNGSCTLCATCGGRSVVSKVKLSLESCPENKWARLP